MIGGGRRKRFFALLTPRNPHRIRKRDLGQEQEKVCSSPFLHSFREDYLAFYELKIAIFWLVHCLQHQEYCQHSTEQFLEI